MRRKRICILVVDDEDGSLLIRPFDEAGYATVYETTDTAATLAKALRKPKWDLILCAESTPELSASCVLELVKQYAVEAPLIVISDSISDAAAAETMRLGASDILPKRLLQRLVPIAERALRVARMTRQYTIMERALRESEARFSSIASNIPGMAYQMIMEANGEFRFPYVSEGAYALLGVQPLPLRDTPSLLVQLLAPEDRPAFHRTMNDSAAALTPWNWEGRIMIGEEREVKWINLRASPRTLEGGAVQWEGLMWNITNSRAAERQILESQQELQALSWHLENIKEHERAKIAREIHDDIGGTLTAIKIDLLWLGARLPSDQAELHEKITTLEDLVDHAMNTSTRIARDLRPSILDFGIVAAVEWQTEEFRKRLGIDCHLTCAEGDIELEPDVAMAVFRIFQETLTNISKHAHATRINVTLGTGEGSILLQVSDNGDGVAQQDLSKPRSFGIRGMLERARHLGGDVSVKRASRKGTIVTVRIPLNARLTGERLTEDQRMLF